MFDALISDSSCNTGVVGMAAISNFFPTLTESLGFGRVISLLLVAPPFVLITAIALMYGFISDRKGVRFWFFVCPVPVVIIGALLFMFTDSFGARYFSLFLLVFIYTMSGIVSGTFAVPNNATESFPMLTMNPSCRSMHGWQAQSRDHVRREQWHWHSLIALAT
jgi:MFS family permease